jgi:hypothetical protein
MIDNAAKPPLANGSAQTEKRSFFSRLVLNPLSLFILIAIAFFVTLSFYALRDTESTPELTPDSSTDRAATSPKSGQSDIAPVILTSQKKAATKPNSQEKNVQQDPAKKKKIKSIAGTIYEELRKEEAITTHTIILKTGEEMNCTLISDMGTHWKIRYRGMITIIDKERIETFKSRSPESVETGLRKMALEQATRIVDEGLVRYEGNWMTPEEKELRIHVAKTEAEIEKLQVLKNAGKPLPPAKKTPITKKQPIESKDTGKIDSSTITMVAGFGFDDIVVGHPRCTKALIKSKLGEPHAEKEHVLDYDNTSGMTFIMAADTDLLIEIHLSKKFRGKLFPDLSFASSLDDIFDAYGDPVEEKTVEDFGVPYYKYRNRTLYSDGVFGRLAYRDLGLLFWLANDRINQIVIHRK